MSVEQHNVVDFLAIDPQTQNLTLVISDHLPWDDVKTHLFNLQEKLNCYFRFVESGELAEKSPAAKGRPITMEIILQYEIPETAIWFFHRAADASDSVGIKLTWRMFR